MNDIARRSISSVLALVLLGMAAPSLAAPAQKLEWNLERQDLDGALRAIGRSSGREIFFSPEAVKGRQAPPLSGAYTALEAVVIVLRGTRLTAVERDGVILIREQFSASSDDTLNSGESIVVTGSRIRGGPSTSPVTATTRIEAQQRGQSDLGQLMRDIPQNFSGGQNPTITAGGQGGFTNVSGSSALNLRGLGPDASLTLINGHRVAFDAISQGVDISAIPLAAIERVDVVADGASALYGSDAVAGVANVVLRRSVNGVETSARFGAATDGGAATQQYSIVGGSSWPSGGFMIAADYQDATAISARQRSYTSNVAPDTTLIPAQDQISLVASGRQSITDSIAFEIDAHYMHRSTSRCLIGIVATSCLAQGSHVKSTADGWSLSPALKAHLPFGWDVRLSGTYSKSDTNVVTRVFSAGTEIVRALPNYSNELKSIELGAEGALFTLPGGEARLAIGLGYRSNNLAVDSRRLVAGVESVTEAVAENRKVGFAYGELFLPLISAGNAVPFVDKLQLIGALRYEDHHDIDRMATPKIGMVYSPVEGLEFKGSWGRSFKAPNLYQTAMLSNAQLLSASEFDPAPSNGFPVLYLFGGNKNLKPERATTWNVSVALTPHALEGFKAEVSYFNTRYYNRVGSPIVEFTKLFDSVYNQFTKIDPSSAEVLDAINGITGVFQNFTDGDFDPSSVSAIVQDYLQNISVQKLEGFDLSVTYTHDFQDYGQATINGSASYLKSTREVIPGLPLVEQAGIIFTPPHWRGRVTANWQKDNVTLSSTVNFIGKTDDNRFEPTVSVGSFTTFDTVATIRSNSASGILANIEWQVGIQNLFNTKPPAIRTNRAAQVLVDSVNHSLYGRTASITLRKRW
ncbi:TonB-dependent receptor [Sphingobium sp. BHU LFT2]|uniref:TonB-dependent receptor n=1 Tax=Sphingobium sp. BHU LFT2 TaxID=2807634 RepID=UPI001BE83AE8|nr:TonB-dependent receptor [Sphingobium sp. BHU LFT2]MBT2246838.1 TonB-dependent receptor [Sphingobium sp. BHU LFT2]